MTLRYEAQNRGDLIHLTDTTTGDVGYYVGETGAPRAGIPGVDLRDVKVLDQLYWSVPMPVRPSSPDELAAAAVEAIIERVKKELT